MRLKAALFLALGASTLGAQQDPTVVHVATFLHIVSDFDQAIDFYHGTLGLELTGHSVPPNMIDSPPVANMYGVPGQQYRAAVVKIPGSPLLLELVQWGPARKAAQQHAADPGEITLIWRRADAASANTLTRDPDGFPVQVVKSENPGADLSISVADTGKTAELFRNVLGFKADGEWLAAPDGATRVRFTKAGSSAGKEIPFPSPGRGSVRLAVHGIAGMASKLTAAGLTPVTTGGAPVTLPYNGPQAMILRDSNGFALQLVETK